jgi:hypothetical protein
MEILRRSVFGSPPDFVHALPEDLGHEFRDNPHVEYAVDVMVVLRCTQTLQLRLKKFDDVPDVRSTTKLGDWSGNLIRMGNRPRVRSSYSSLRVVAGSV